MDGTHENVPLVYHGIGGLMTIVRRKTDQIAQLRMSKLNDSRKLLAKAGVLEDHKQLILAIASGRVERVAPLVQAALKNGAGIGTIIQQYERAAEKLYKPKGYTNEDIMRSIVFASTRWRTRCRICSQVLGASEPDNHSAQHCTADIGRLTLHSNTH
jgi:hypothetical protein